MVNYDVIIVGAGPSGLMSAVNIVGKRVLLLDKNERVGGKIKVSGGGKCNVSTRQSPDKLQDYIPHNNKFLFSTFNRFNNLDVIDFFESNGLELAEKDNFRMFPKTDRSVSVIEFFERLLLERGVDVRINFEVDKIVKKNDLFVVNECFSAKRLVLCTGGKSYPTTGTTGDGYRFLEEFGHSVTELYPCESPLVSSDVLIASKELQGVSVKDCLLEVFVGNKCVKSLNHSMLFTHFGMSGPGILHCSYFVLQAFNRGKKVMIRISDIKDCPQRLVKYLDEDGSLSVNVSDIRGFKSAFVTCGGANLKQIDPKCFGSKIVDGLFVVGELLDINAFTGGYNLTTCFCEGLCLGEFLSSVD